MKKLFTFLFLFLSVSFVFSQETDNRIERLKALRVAFLSDRLELTPEEAQKFWPLFNQYETREIELKKSKHQLTKKLRSSSNLSETEIAKLMEQDDVINEELQKTKKQFVTSLKSFLPNKKIVQLRQIEIEFKQKLLERIKDKRRR